MTDQIYYEDIEVGFTLPVLTKCPTPRQLVMWAGAAREFSEMHYDIEFARDKGFPGIIVHGMLMASFLAQMVTSWIGVLGVLKKFKTRNEKFLLVGNTIDCKGVVVKKFRSNDDHCLEIDLAVEQADGERCVTAIAIVSLPSKSRGGLWGQSKGIK